MASLLQPSFAKGEIAPSIYGRVDTALYRVALRKAYNVEIRPQGGASNRFGTQFIAPVKTHTATPRLIPFIFNSEDQYVLEFGNQYMRVIRNDAQVLDSTTTKTITGITRANPGVVTATSHGYSNGNYVYISGVIGMTEVNGRWFKVANVATHTFELTDPVDDSNIDTTNYTVYSSAGSVSKVYELSTPYATADLRNIKFVQKNDVMTLVHKDYAIRDLSRTDHDEWTLTAKTFNPTQPWPTAITVTAGVVGDRRARYTVTAIGDDGESLAGVSNDSTTPSAITKANPCKITTSASHGYSTGDEVYITGVGGMTELNGRRFRITVVDADEFTLNDENSTSYTTFTSGGSIYRTFDEITLANISGATQANPCVLTVSNGHGIVALDEVLIDDVAGMTALNGRRFIVSAETSTTITLDNENSTGYGAYTSGGAIWRENTALNDISWTAASGAKRYAIYKEKNGLFGKIGESETTEFRDNNLAVDLTTSPPQFVEPFNSSTEYPGAVSYFEQRKVYGGSSGEPDRTDYSRTGTLNDFTGSIPLQSDDAFTVSLPSTQYQEIRHYVPLNVLLVFTAGGEWVVDTGSDTGFAFDTIRQRLQTEYGCADELRPLIAGNIVIFAEENAAEVRTLGYSLADDKYTGIDLSLQAQHLLEQYAIVDWDYAHSPDGRLYMVRSDGKGLCLTFNAEQEVIAWSTFETDGDFERVCVLRHSTTELEDRIYYVVKRSINGRTVRYIERLGRTTELTVAEEEGVAAVEWSISGSATVSEGNTGTYTVSYSGTLPSGQTATIAVASASGTATSATDFTALSTTLTFTGGGVTSKTVAVSTIEDTAVEGTEDFVVNLSNASVGTIGTSQAETDIIDDDSAATLTVDWTYGTTINGGGTPKTYSAVAIGTAASDRMVVVGVKGDGGGGQPTGVTIGGSAATKIVEANDGTQFASLWARMVSSGTTADIVVTWSSAPSRQGISVYAVYGESGVTAYDTASSVANPPSTNALTIPANGVGIALAVGGGATNWTWVGLTEDYDANSSGMANSSASLASSSATTPTITATPNSGTSNALVAASWAP